MLEKKTLETTEEKMIKNFYPCVINGRADSNAVCPTNSKWNAIGWKIISDKKDNELEMLAVFYAEDSADSRAFFLLNPKAGRISHFFFEPAASFQREDAYNIESVKVHCNESRDAFNYAVRLVRYFGRVASAEFKKETIVKEPSAKRNVTNNKAGERYLKRLSSMSKIRETTSPKELPYHPDAPKISYISADKPQSHKVQKNFNVESWQRAGHYRTYKSGKVVYIKPSIVHRRLTA